MDEPNYTEWGSVCRDAARTEGLMVARLMIIADHWGLSRGTGRVVFLDEARRRHDVFVEIVQWCEARGR